jgi:hypothetical protein
VADPEEKAKSVERGNRGKKRSQKPKRSIFNPLKGCGRGKIWAEDAKAQLRYLNFKLEAIKARNHAICQLNGVHRWIKQKKLHATPLPPEAIKTTCEQVNELANRVEDALTGSSPQYRPLISWWSGTCTEAAYRNLHYAEAAIARLYSEWEIIAELPDAVRRLNAALSDGNPTRVLANTYVRDNRLVKACSPTELSHFIAIGHEASDRIRAKLRMFRNIILIGTLVMTLILAGVVFWAYKLPDIIPLCFTHGPDPDTSFVVSCPTAEYLDQVAMKDQSKPPPNGGDVFTMRLMQNPV